MPSLQEVTGKKLKKKIILKNVISFGDLSTIPLMDIKESIKEL
jgi:hypothetical protein